MDNLLKGIGLVVGVLALIVGLSALLALPVKWLWNYVMVDQFDLKPLDFLHAWALLVLAGFLTRGSSTTTTKN